MEENNQLENNVSYADDKKKYECSEKFSWKRCLAMMGAAFLGGFLAVYFVTDQIMERSFYKHHKHFNPHSFEKKINRDFDRMYKNDMKAFDDAFKKMERKHKKQMDAFPMPMMFMDPVKVKTEFDDNKFNIIVGLKPFQNDENKVNYNVKGRKITVFGKSEIKEKDYVNDISFSQDIILPEKSDIANIQKIKDDDKLIISVPIKE